VVLRDAEPDVGLRGPDPCFFGPGRPDLLPDDPPRADFEPPWEPRRGGVGLSGSESTGPPYQAARRRKALKIADITKRERIAEYMGLSSPVPYTRGSTTMCPDIGLFVNTG
jgi:hypothetical protein